MNNRTRNILLVLGFLLCLVLSYQLAISKTFTLRKEYKQLSQQQTLFENTPKQISLLNKKQTYFDSILSKYQIKESSLQNSLLKAINTFAEKNNISVTDFFEPHTINNSDLTINTFIFSLEGDYNSILKLIHKIEQESKFGEIINLHFEKKKNFRTGRNYLEARVLLKSFG